MNTINTISTIIEYALLAWAVFTCSYMLIYAVFSKLYKPGTQKKKLNSQNAPRIAVLIPAYKEDSVIMKTVASSLKQDYPVGKYTVTVIADTLLPSTLVKLNHQPIHLLKVEFETSTKSKALNAALNYLPDNAYDIAVVLDADNLINTDFLTHIGTAYLNGHKAIQGHRTAKNTNTPYALLDAISEEINNNIFCKGPQFAGLSSRLTGSGMGFDFKLFKRLLSKINAVGGFDKELELKLLSKRIKIRYIPEAIVFDEKTSKPDTIARQRTRWISSQFHYMKQYLPLGIYQLFIRKNFDYFNKSIQLLILPRVFMLLNLVLGSILHLINSNSITLGIWLPLSAMYLLIFLISFPTKFLNKSFYKLIPAMVSTLIKIIRSIPSMQHANKKFIHTPHHS